MMNQYRSELLEQYLEKVLFVQSAERDHGRGELAQLAVQYLNTADPKQRLSEQIGDVFSVNVIANTLFDFAAARKVFSIMEKYVINLLDCPWKREFRKITMYSGFYKTRIEPSLKDAWKLLLMVGYEKVGMCLELKFLPDASRLQDIALEFFLASLECLIYKDVFQKVSFLGLTLGDIHNCRVRISGNSDVLAKELYNLCMSEKRHEGASSETTASRQVWEYLSKGPKHQQFEKNSEYESKVGSGIQTGGMQSESSQWHMGYDPNIIPRSEPEKDGSDCGSRTESFESMLRDITPEMISDSNIRKKILAKLNKNPEDETLHGSLPLHQAPCKSAAASSTRPHTEPLFIPKQLQVVVPSASDTRPFIEPPVNLKQQKIESKVVPNVQSGTVALPVPKENLAVGLGQRPWTEPLLIPKQRFQSKRSSKTSETILPQWQCGHCYFSNNAAINVEKCATCGMSRKEI